MSDKLKLIHVTWLLEGDLDAALYLLNIPSSFNLNDALCETLFNGRPKDWTPEDSFKVLRQHNLDVPTLTNIASNMSWGENLGTFDRFSTI